MIILDTNVISALMRRSPDHAVVDWLDRQDRDQIHTSAVNVYELHYGVLTQPDAAVRRRLELSLAALFGALLAGRILPFDAPAAEAAADLEAKRKLAGTLKGVRDVQIAGVAIANGAALCTRNIRHFQDAGIALVNPWT